MEQTEQMFISDRIPFRGTKIEANVNNSVRHPFAEENPTRNSVSWSQNRCEFSEFHSESNRNKCLFPTEFRLFRGRENLRFRSESFRRRENNSEFRSVEQQQKQTSIILFGTLLRKRTQNSILFRSIPSCGIGSFSEFGMPRNECFKCVIYMKILEQSLLCFCGVLRYSLFKYDF